MGADNLPVCRDRAGRRLFGVADKVRLVEEAGRAGQGISVVARRHGVHPTQLYRWRRAYRAGTLKGHGFVAVPVKKEGAKSGTGMVPAGAASLTLEFGWGDKVRIEGAIAPDLLRVVIETLRT